MSPLKRKLAFLIVVAAVAASAAGAYAATQASSVSPRQSFLSDVARRLHVTTDQLKKAVDGAYADRLSALVAAGRLSKAQAKAIEKGLAGAGAPPGFWMLGGMAQVIHPGLHRGWFAYGPGTAVGPNAKALPRLHGQAKVPPPGALPPAAAVPGGPGVPMPPLPAPGFGLLLPGGMKTAISYLGISPAKLVAELRAGKSLAQIAKAQGRTAAGLESAVAASVKARLNRQVAQKHLTRTQANHIMKAIDARIAAVMNLRMGAPPGRMGPFGPRGAGHFKQKLRGAAAPGAGPALWPA